MKKLNTTLLIVGLGLIGLITIAAVTTVTTVPQNLANLVCADTSGSGTAQVCTTTPSFTIATGSSIVYTTTTSNTGDLTINVNSLGAKHVRKRGSARVLATSDMPSGTSMWLTYDGLYWEMYMGSLAESDLALSNNTTNDVSTSQHGFAPKADGSANDFLNGLGTYTRFPGLGIFYVNEDFCGGAALEGTVGTNMWFADVSEALGIAKDTNSQPDANHPCGLTFQTGTVAGNHAFTYLLFCADQQNLSSSCGTGTGNTAADVPANGVDSLPALGTIPFDSTFIVKALATTNTAWGVGYFDWGNGATCGGGTSAPTDAICVRYRTDSNAGGPDTNIQFKTCKGGVCNQTDSGVAPVAGDWTKIRIRSTTGGTILYSLCQSAPPAGCTLGAETSISNAADVPTAAMTPNIGTKFMATSSSILVVEHFDIAIPVSR